MNGYEKLAKIVGSTAQAMQDLDSKMVVAAGVSDAMERVATENDQIVDRVLSEVGLLRESTAEDVYNALTQRLLAIDGQLFELLGRPDLSKMADDPGKLASVALQVFTPPKGFFIKKEKVAELLAKQPPQSLLGHFHYTSVQELLDQEGFASVVAALRFTQTTEWMHKFFDTAYNGLTAEDFEERDVEIKILDTKWLDIAQKFIGKKFHNVSHLKEFGVIFISPEPIDVPGETLRTFLLLLHYLHEVPFYSGLFRKFIKDGDFIAKLQSLLRGDVPEGPGPADAVSWRIVQRYLAKDDPMDPRLSEHHVDPEAEHWYQVAHNFPKVAELMGDTELFNLAYWTELDHVGDFFKNAEGKDVLLSFDIVDLVMSLVKHGEVKYLYHQQEALWNRIFSEYVGRDTMNALIADNIITGWIKL